MGPGTDIALIELIYDEESGRYVLVLSGFVGDGTRAASLLIQLLGSPHSPIVLQGIAMIIQWTDTNLDAKVDPQDSWNVLEIIT